MKGIVILAAAQSHCTERKTSSIGNSHFYCNEQKVTIIYTTGV